MRALRGSSRIYKRWAVDDVMVLGDDAVPALLAILDAVLEADPASKESDDLGPLYALSLLAHMGVRAAHDRFLALARFDRDRFEFWFGGYLTEQLDAALLRTANGDLDGVRSLVRDRHADGYLRSHAADALVGAVALGQADRDEVLELVVAQLDPGASADPESYVWSAVGAAILDLHGVEYMQQLIEACETGLIEPGHFGADYVRERLGGPPVPLEPRCLDLVRTPSVHKWLGWWACFQDGVS